MREAGAEGLAAGTWGECLGEQSRQQPGQALERES